MKQYFLIEIITRDNLILHGIYFEPKKQSDTAILWVHGLTDNFYSHSKLFDAIVEVSESPDFAKATSGTVGFASFNTRGHDMIAEISQIDKTNPSGHGYVRGGAGYEKFTDSVCDIDAGITFLVKQGYKKVVLVGLSTGANKVCFYAGTKDDPRVAGVVLAGPLSDRSVEEKNNRKLPQNLRRMRHMIEKGKSDFLVNNLTFFPLTPKRYLSLYDKSSLEDVFDYAEKKPKLKIFQKIKSPLLVVFSEADEYADLPPAEILKVFDTYAKSNNYSSTLIGRISHGFDGKEKEFAETIINWTAKI